MKIEGTYTFQAPEEKVWNCLMDQPTIQHAFPGLERLTLIDEQTYSFAIHIRHAPMRGTYTGRARITEQDSPASYYLKIEGEGQSRTFLSECDLQISTHAENTIVSYRGDLQLGRSGALIPAQLVRATIKMLLQQFFTSIAEQLRTTVEGPVYINTLEEIYDIPFIEEPLSIDLAIKDQPHPFLHRLVHLLGAGKQSAETEEQWVQRLRQVGMLTILLLLVWVGTRLPRRLFSRS
jgi:carbon monoxide dehydrogenase subunit G